MAKPKKKYNISAHRKAAAKGRVGGVATDDLVRKIVLSYRMERSDAVKALWASISNVDPHVQTYIRHRGKSYMLYFCGFENGLFTMSQENLPVLSTLCPTIDVESDNPRMLEAMRTAEEVRVASHKASSLLNYLGAWAEEGKLAHEHLVELLGAPLTAEFLQTHENILPSKLPALTDMSTAQKRASIDLLRTMKDRAQEVREMYVVSLLLS